jgi:hypothetical protein
MTYAIVQNGYAIFGTGDTLEAAYRDAQKWVDDLCPLDELTNDPDKDGDMFWATITPALAEEVDERGGDIAWGKLSDGTLCTIAEQTS